MTNIYLNHLLSCLGVFSSLLVCPTSAVMPPPFTNRNHSNKKSGSGSSSTRVDMKDNLRARNLDVGDVATFDPPIRYNQYMGGCDSEDGPLYEGFIESIEVLAEDEFCLIDEGDGVDSYTKYVIEECAETGTIESYYTCADDSCEDCTLAVLALAPTYANRSVAGICYNYTYSTDLDNVDSLFDPSTSFAVQTEFVVDLDDIEEGVIGDDLEDITTYVSTIVDNSCIDEGTLIIVDEDELIVIDEDGGTTVVPSDIATLEPQVDTMPDKISMVGSDRDEYGCIPSAGYSWCAEKEKCIRPWEEDCGDEPDGECTTLTDIACAPDAEDFTVLCSLVTSYPDIVEALESTPFTLFAPTDEAFGDIQDLLDTLSEDEIGDILGFHAYMGIGSPLMYDDLECTELFEMANGYYSRTKCVKDKEFGTWSKGQKGGGNRKNGKIPMIVSPDIEACGGIVQVIDAVMLPNYMDEIPGLFD